MKIDKNFFSKKKELHMNVLVKWDHFWFKWKTSLTKVIIDQRKLRKFSGVILGLHRKEQFISLSLAKLGPELAISSALLF